MKFLLALTLVLGVSTAFAGDFDSPESTVKALYEVISGPAGAKRDWDRMRSIFATDAKMAVVGKRQNGEIFTRTLTVEDYIKQSGPVLEQRGFFEKEVAKRAETFGGLTHVWSTYESRAKADDAKPFARGINSIQLWNDGKRWWVLSVVWQAEDASTPLPEKYLKSGR